MNLRDELLRLLFEEDPVGINYGENVNEYAPEVDALLPQLEACASPAEVLDLVYRVFREMFEHPSSEMTTKLVGDVARYQAVADKIWALIKT